MGLLLSQFCMLGSDCLGHDGLGLEYRRQEETFLSPEPSRPAHGPTVT